MFEPFFMFPYIGNVIIPTDELICFRGVAIPPIYIYIYTHMYVFYLYVHSKDSYVEHLYIYICIWNTE